MTDEVAVSLLQVRRRLIEERGRAKFLHSTTEQPLINACQLELIEAWLPQLSNEFDGMLRSHETDGKITVLLHLCFYRIKRSYTAST